MTGYSFHKYLLIVLFSIGLFSCNTSETYDVRNGVIDLKNYKFKPDEKINLIGEWEFYHNQLLTPSDFSNNKVPKGKSLIHVPQSWTNENEFEKYKDKGFATYRLRIITTDTLTPILIENRRIFTAYKAWLNGKLIYNAGNVADNKTEHKPDLQLLISDHLQLKKNNELIIQVSNYDDGRSGIISPVKIGEYNSSYADKIIELILIISVLSIIFFIAVYHLVLFIYQKSEHSNLVFSILAFLIVIYGIFSNDTLFKNIINPGFDTITRLFHLVVSVYPALITLFFYLLFKHEVSKKVLKFSIVISIIFLIFSLFFNIYWVRKIIFIKILYTFFISIYFILKALPKAIKNKRQGAVWAFIGMLFLFIANLNDILFSQGLLKTSYIGIYGFVLYIIFQSINIAERFSYTSKRNKSLAEILRKQNIKYLLLNKDYKIQNNELKLSKEKAEESDSLKSAFLANMSHEIRTPMNAIIGFSNLLSENEFESEKRKRLLSYIISSSNTLLQLINDIIDISKIEAGQLEINKEDSDINEIFTELQALYNEKNHSVVDLKFILNKENLSIYTDQIRLKQVLINLADNALKFTETGSIEISYKPSEVNSVKMITFCVKDSGIGLSSEQQEIIFNRFTKLEQEKEKLYRGAGLGLAISKNIVHLLGGEIKVESELYKGSVFYFTLPEK